MTDLRTVSRDSPSLEWPSVGRALLMYVYNRRDGSTWARCRGCGFSRSDGDFRPEDHSSEWCSVARLEAALFVALPAVSETNRDADRMNPTIQHEQAVIDAAHLERQRRWSIETFGPGRRTGGVLAHIRKELVEIEAEPDSLEWIDVVILALDGAWRAGYAPQAIIDAIVAKQTKNEGRRWPDWRTASEDQAIEHDRSADGFRAARDGKP